MERHETRNHSQIWCFGTQHWDTRDRQSKTSGTAYEMLQDERSGTDAGTTAAAQPGLWQIGRNICGSGVEQQAAVVRPRAHEAFSPGLIGATRARSLARGSLTRLFSSASHAVTRHQGREHGRAAVSTRHPGSWKARLHMQPSRLSLIWFATGST